MYLGSIHAVHIDVCICNNKNLTLFIPLGFFTAISINWWKKCHSVCTVCIYSYCIITFGNVHTRIRIHIVTKIRLPLSLSLSLKSADHTCYHDRKLAINITQLMWVEQVISVCGCRGRKVRRFERWYVIEEKSADCTVIWAYQVLPPRYVQHKKDPGQEPERRSESHRNFPMCS